MRNGMIKFLPPNSKNWLQMNVAKTKPIQDLPSIKYIKPENISGLSHT